MNAHLEKQTDPFVLLDDTLSGAGSVLFVKPEAVIQCDEVATLEMCFSDMEKAQHAGKHLAGYLSYELGYLFEPRLQGLPKKDNPLGTPLLWFGVFDQAQLLTPDETNRFLARQRWGDYQLDNLTPSMTEADYCRAVEKVRDYIAAGDTYQVNYTFKHDFKLSGDPVGLFQELRQRQNVANGAFIRTEDQTFLSLSPEIFLSTEGRKARTRPMKGTAPRGNTPAVDAENKIWLTRDEKSRAENLMIVDLLRNDMGRVCTTGSIKVTELFTVETYRSLHQMTSNITGELRPEITSTDLIKRLFPCGSITGAPKLRTMEIIHELEARPRGIYTGSIGHIAPNGDTRFNVAIRTLAIGSDGKGEMGIGSGIVYDSEPAAEYQECLLKGRFLSGNTAGYSKPRFDLLETLRWEENLGYHLREEHLQRLENSAGFFGYPFDRTVIESKLDKLSLEGTQRVRLLLHKDGSSSLTTMPISIQDPQQQITFVVSDKKVDSSDIFFYHKTTKRDFYEDELAARQKDSACDEVLFLNERGELTEGARTNLFLEIGGRLYTPALDCGVLNGTLRTRLFRENFKELTEKKLSLEDLEKADVIYFGNSVRDLMPARQIKQSGRPD